MSIEIINSKLEDWSASYDGPKFHAVLCDPPYGLEFMGKEWDSFTSYAGITEGNGYPGGRRKSINFTGSPNPTCKKCGGLRSLNTEGSGGRTKCKCDSPDFPNYRVPAMRAYEDKVRLWGEAIIPHLYPGALVLMFGGTRTWHRLACGMEDAGFEMWDTLMWLHGQGFPKAQAIDKLIDGKNGDERGEVIGHVTVRDGAKRNPAKHKSPAEGSNIGKWGLESTPHGLPITAPGSEQSAPWSGHKTTALKPAWEPVLCFKKPLEGTYADAAMKYGSGALNVDGGRIATGDNLNGGTYSPNGKANPMPGDERTGAALGMFAPGARPDRDYEQPLGRYPANLILDPESAAQLDAMTGDRPAGASVSGHEPSTPSLNCYGEYGRVPFNGFGDSGGAARFYYCAKSSTAERNVGCEYIDPKRSDYRPNETDDQVTGNGLRERLHNSTPRRNHHPTVKPIGLCKYLATLLLPPDSVQPRRLLVPFSGSGSEMIGSMLAGWDEIVGIEQDTEHGYVDIAHARLDWWQWAKERSGLTDVTAILTRFGFIEEQVAEKTGQQTLFG